MGLKNISKRIKNYKSKIKEKKDWENKLKKELELARRESYRKEALKRAAISGRIQASRPMGYSYFAGLTTSKSYKKRR